MTYKISWYIPDRVLAVELPVTCDSKTMGELDAEVISLLKSASQTVHVLVDLRPMKNYPAFDTSRKMKYFKHARMGEMIVIGMTLSPGLRFLGRLFAKTVGIDVHDFTTPEEAHNYVHSMREFQS